MELAVLTRDEVQPYQAAFAALGFEVVAMPVTRFAPPADPGALARALAAGDHAAIVVASPRAAYELGRAKAAALVELPEVWAVGPSTKRALDIAQIAATHPADVRDGAELAQKLVASRSLAGKRVLVPRAEEGRDEAIKVLRAAGAEIDDVIAYRTVPAAADDPKLARGRELLVSGGAEVCAVFAPSQVSALAELVPITSLRCRFAAIGATTASALAELGVRDVAVAATPTPDGMAQALVRRRQE
jgi:uroporphyrinogen-III synthase